MRRALQVLKGSLMVRVAAAQASSEKTVEPSSPLDKEEEEKEEEDDEEEVGEEDTGEKEAAR